MHLSSHQRRWRFSVVRPVRRHEAAWQMSVAVLLCQSSTQFRMYSCVSYDEVALAANPGSMYLGQSVLGLHRPGYSSSHKPRATRCSRQWLFCGRDLFTHRFPVLHSLLLPWFYFPHAQSRPLQSPWIQTPQDDGPHRRRTSDLYPGSTSQSHPPQTVWSPPEFPPQHLIAQAH